MEQNPPRAMHEPFREEVKNLPRWNIKEPSDVEFEEWKKSFMRNKQKDADLRKLSKYIGQLKSHIDELNHVIDSLFEQKCKEMTPEQYKDFMFGLMKLKKDMAHKEKGEPLTKHQGKKLEYFQSLLIKHGIKW